MSIYLTALIRSKAGHSEEMKKLLLELVAGSTTEAACLQYDLHQSLEDPDLFIFHEKWAGKEGLDLHGTQPHILKFISESAPIMEGKTILHQTKQLS